MEKKFSLELGKSEMGFQKPNHNKYVITDKSLQVPALKSSQGAPAEKEVLLAVNFQFVATTTGSRTAASSGSAKGRNEIVLLRDTLLISPAIGMIQSIDKDLPDHGNVKFKFVLLRIDGHLKELINKVETPTSFTSYGNIISGTPEFQSISQLI